CCAGIIDHAVAADESLFPREVRPAIAVIRRFRVNPRPSIHPMSPRLGPDRRAKDRALRGRRVFGFVLISRREDFSVRRDAAPYNVVNEFGVVVLRFLRSLMRRPASAFDSPAAPPR